MGTTLRSLLTPAAARAMTVEAARDGRVSRAEVRALRKAQSLAAGEARAELTRFLDEQARAFSTARLHRLSGDGLTSRELQTVSASLCELYGDAGALRKAVRDVASRLSLDAVAWLKQQAPLNGHLKRLEEVLREHLPGSDLLDADLDGTLDDEDLVFRRTAAGAVEATSIGPALRRRVAIGAALVNACEEMDRARHRFSSFAEQSFSGAMWMPREGERTTFQVKPGVKPSVAVQHICAHPDEYRFECATAIVIVYYKAILELIGPEDFDRAYPELKIGPWNYDSKLEPHIRLTGSSRTEAAATARASLQVGDYTFIRNWDVTREARAGGWQGENVIYLGNGRFYGHPFGIATDAEIIEFLNERRMPGSTRSASLSEVRRRIESSILDEDRLPG